MRISDWSSDVCSSDLRILFVDPGFVDLAEALAPNLASVETFVVPAPRAEVPPNRLDALGLDEFLDLGRAAPDAGWGGFPESRAHSLFYTSGTTSAPTGDLYSHRSCLPNPMVIRLTPQP